MLGSIWLKLIEDISKSIPYFRRSGRIVLRITLLHFFQTRWFQSFVTILTSSWSEIIKINFIIFLHSIFSVLKLNSPEADNAYSQKEKKSENSGDGDGEGKEDEQ